MRNNDNEERRHAAPPRDRREGIGAQGEGHHAPPLEGDRATYNEGIAGNGPNRPAQQGNSDFANTGLNSTRSSTGGRDNHPGTDEVVPGTPGGGKVGTGTPESQDDAAGD